MWAEVIFSRDDLKGLLEQAFPLTIHLDVERRHSLSLSDLGEVKLVEDLGLHVVCKARIHWPLLGIDVPVNVSSLALVLIPTIEPGPDGDLLAFRASIEHADFAALPALLDDRITAAINARLSSKGSELSWNFRKRSPTSYTFRRGSTRSSRSRSGPRGGRRGSRAMRSCAPCPSIRRSSDAGSRPPPTCSFRPRPSPWLRSQFARNP